MAGLENLTILVPESRELDLFAAMLEKEGASALRCPLVAIRDLDDTAQAQAWIARAADGGFDDIVWLTGEGVRRLLPIARRHGRETAFLDALARLRNITRGPKPVRALRELGLSPGLTATTPTSQGVLEAMAGLDLNGRRIGVQLYPGSDNSLAANFTARGAQVFPLTPYRYADDADDAAVIDAIRKLAAGRIGLVVFTASPQIDRLLQVARRNGLSVILSTGLSHTPVAAIGPVVEEVLRLNGITPVLRPEGSFHLKPLIRAIQAWRAA